MSNLVVIAREMYKVAQFSIDVKYRRPGNVVEYLPVKFEIFRDGEYYKAIPSQDFQTRILTNLPKALKFEIKEGKILNYSADKEVVEDIVNKLLERKCV
ncbi:MAG TPA: hypothetical protein VK369_05725 [Segetibacter sp.]|nr:hypothetical protein [Segetibacter sp.]